MVKLLCKIKKNYIKMEWLVMALNNFIIWGRVLKKCAAALQIQQLNMNNDIPHNFIKANNKMPCQLIRTWMPARDVRASTCDKTKKLRHMLADILINLMNNFIKMFTQPRRLIKRGSLGGGEYFVLNALH